MLLIVYDHQRMTVMCPVYSLVLKDAFVLYALPFMLLWAKQLLSSVT